jgi:hypothetical protein
MGTLDDLKDNFGDGVLDRPTGRTSQSNWHDLCVCGHLDRYHAPSTGGLYELVPTRTVSSRGEEFTQSQTFTGCVGALMARGLDDVTTVVDREAKTVTQTINPTCPCTEFRPVVHVDRPNRFFNQRIPADLGDRTRHPFIVGIRAFTTHLGKRKAADPERGGSPEWVTAEFERRFTWIEENRRCDISRCRTADETVWPCFVTDGEAISELRCGSHRPS